MAHLPIKDLIQRPPKVRISSGHRLARVLKTPQGFQCGWCGLKYESVQQAWHCVTKDVLPLKSILTYNANQISYFCCLLCLKSYVHERDAALCMARDLSSSSFPKNLAEHLLKLVTRALGAIGPLQKKDPLLTRQASYGIPDPWGVHVDVFSQLPGVSKKAFGADTSKKQGMGISLQEKQTNGVSSSPKSEDLIPMIVANSPKVSAQSLTATTNSQEFTVDLSNNIQAPLEDPLQKKDPTEFPQGDEVPVVSVPPPEKPKPLLFRQLGQKPFARHDARYVCSVCKEKFFTKTEAESHFMTHPLAP